MDLQSRIGGAVVTIGASGYVYKPSFDFAVNGRPARARFRKTFIDEGSSAPGAGPSEWTEDQSIASTLHECLSSKHTKRTSDADSVSLELFSAGLSGMTGTDRVVISLDSSGVVLIDMTSINHPIDPNVGW